MHRHVLTCGLTVIAGVLNPSLGWADLWECPQAEGPPLYSDRQLPGCKPVGDPSWKDPAGLPAASPALGAAPSPPVARPDQPEVSPAAVAPQHSKNQASGSKPRWTALTAAATKARSHGNVPEAERLYKDALKEAEAIDLESHQRAATLYSLGTLYLEQQKYPEADRYLQEAMTIYEEADGAESADVATAMLAYATLLRKTNKVEEAVQFEERAKATTSRR